MGTTLLTVPSKSHAFSINYYICIAMPTWHRCAPPILFWHWPPFNLFPSSCIAWIFFVNSHWWVPLRVQYPTIYMKYAISTNYHVYIAMPTWYIIHVLKKYTYFVLTSINSCFVHVQQHTPPQIAGAGHPCSDRSLFRYTYVCSMMRSYCPNIFVHIGST